MRCLDGGSALAVEVAVNELLEELRISLCLSTEVSILISLEVADQHIDRRRIEDAASFVDSAVLAQTFGRCDAGSRQAIQMSYGTSELILVDVHSDIGVLSELLSIVDLEAVAYCRTDTSQQEVEVSRAVGGTELDRLLIGVALLAGRFEGG